MEEYTVSKPVPNKEKMKTPLRYCLWITNHPKKIMGIGFVFHLLLLLATVAMFLAKYDILPIVFDGLPLILQKDVDYLRSSAWNNRNEDPSIMVRGKGIGNETERSLVGEAFSILYERQNGGNIFTQSYLKKMKSIEDSFLEKDDYQTSFCMVVPSTGQCRPPLSILRFFDGTYQKASPVFHDPEFNNVYEVLDKASKHRLTKKSFTYFLGKDYRVDNTKQTVYSSILRTNIYLGLPLKGFVNATDRRSKQMDLIKDFSVKNYKKHAENTASSYKDQGLNVVYSSTSLLQDYIQSQVIKDMLLAVASMAFIFLIVLIQTQSLFVTFFSIFSIITSFVGTNIIYRVICDYRFFGIFHVLAIFIILGIGADNIFIFFDTWKMEGLRNHPTTAHRLSTAYGKASVAMFFTSITTAAAFFVGAFSPLISLSSFGLFSGLLVIVNYINVIMYLPAIVMVYHRHFENWTWPCCRSCKKQEEIATVKVDNLDLDVVKDSRFALPSASESVPSIYPMESTQNIYLPDSNDTDEKTSVDVREHRLIVRFFRSPFYRFVTHKVMKWIIVLVMLGFAGTCAYFASKLQVNEAEVQFLPESTNYGKYLKLRNTGFKDADTRRYLKIYLIWGMMKQDHSDCHHSDFKCKGRTVWDDSFDINKSPVIQMAFQTFCKNLKQLPEDQVKKLRIERDPVTNKLGIECFIDDYQTFLKNEENITGSQVDIPLNLTKSLAIMRHYSDVFNVSQLSHTYSKPFEIPLTFWLCGKYKSSNNSTKKCQRTEQFNKFNNLLGEAFTKYSVEVPNIQGVKYGTQLKYAAIQINTTMVASSVGYTTGLVVRDAWEDFLDQQKQAMPQEMQNGFQTALLWNFLKVKKSISQSAFMGILIGMCIALPILLIATMNIVVGLAAFFSLSCVIAAVIATMVVAGWKLGILESINLILVVGLSVDYIVHLAEAYSRSKKQESLDRVRDALEEVGISVLSGGLTTLGASFFMIFSEILFFTQFAIFIFSTIGFSLLFALFLFIPLMAVLGPSNDCGSFTALFRRCCKSTN